SLPEYTVTFTVTDGENPIEGATVTVNQEDVVTDASGIATFQLVDGTYAYGVTKEGYEPGSGEIVVDGADVSEAVELVLISSVGSEAMNSLAIFPNPAAEFFNIASARKIATVRVFNVTGQEVLTISDINEEKYTVNTSMLNNGIYIVSVTDNNGFTSSKRIVKK
ncbi:MAG TPA: T9SS type A sorting domain-containing protein, partial [Tenuifilaceae bacterium]|nr:T9SS type A sorting domain-containing protein [Tenuifilaceae bacterium]